MFLFLPLALTASESYTECVECYYASAYPNSAPYRVVLGIGIQLRLVQLLWRLSCKGHVLQMYVCTIWPIYDVFSYVGMYLDYFTIIKMFKIQIKRMGALERGYIKCLAREAKKYLSIEDGWDDLAS